MLNVASATGLATGRTDLKGDSTKRVFLTLKTCSFIFYGNGYMFRSAPFTDVEIEAFTTHKLVHAPSARLFLFSCRVSNLPTMRRKRFLDILSSRLALVAAVLCFICQFCVAFVVVVWRVILDW
jgi:hypothetical protein